MPKFVNIPQSPQVVATVVSSDDLASLARLDLSPVCDLIEIRLDALLADLDAIPSAIAPLEIPLLTTARHPAEGGAGDLTAAHRGELITRFAPLVSWIDVEIRSLQPLHAEVSMAQAAGVGLIASFHDFEKCPSLESLRETIASAIAQCPDVIKIAVHLSTMQELVSLLSLFDDFPDAPLSLMGMGPLGKLSRLVLAKAGSVFNYGYLTEANAPGQWPAAQLKSLIAEL
jgi:3-dehydroquinate dehydratase-1